MTIDHIAEIAHESIRAYARSLGDHTLKFWQKAPKWQREALTAAVMWRVEHPEATPEQMHSDWMVKKMQSGWAYGPELNEDLKQHPSMIAYKDLPDGQRANDELFAAIVNALSPFLARKPQQPKTHNESPTDNPAVAEKLP